MSYPERLEGPDMPWCEHHIVTTPLNCYAVKVTGSKKRVAVQAEYYRISEDGVLTFRTSVRGTYPKTVHVFATGYWLDVINMGVKL